MTNQLAPNPVWILIVEDDETLYIPLRDRLKVEGYAVAIATHSEEVETEMEKREISLVLLDVLLPGKNGFDICRELRQQGHQLPILMLTARGETIDKVVGLKLGADDYLTKPFEMVELLARIETLLRRTQTSLAPGGATYRFGNVRVDFRSAQVFCDETAIALSALEFRLLKYFIANRGALLSRDTLLDNVWGYDAMPFTRTVDAHIASLRQKIEPNPSKPQFILTAHGLGYRFVG